MYSVEVALDLNELEALTNQRRDVRDMLEKAIAVWKATGTFNVTFPVTDIDTFTVTVTIITCNVTGLV